MNDADNAECDRIEQVIIPLVSEFYDRAWTSNVEREFLAAMDKARAAVGPSYWIDWKREGRRLEVEVTAIPAVQSIQGTVRPV